MTVDEIKNLKQYPIQFIKNTGYDRNGNPYNRYSLIFELFNDFVVTKIISAADFYYFVNAVAVPLLKISDNLNKYVLKASFRFIKGSRVNEENNEITEYTLI